MWIGTEAGERSEITQASFVQGLLELVSEHTTDISRNLLTCTLKVGCCRASRGVPVSSEVSPPIDHVVSSVFTEAGHVHEACPEDGNDSWKVSTWGRELSDL